jgi:predicted dehydrogenase
VAGTPEALLASGVDGVVIAAPTDVHPELVLLCVNAGIPAFCEKPVARDSAVAAELARRVADAGTEVQVGYPRRFDAAFAAVRAAVASGELGWVHTVRSTTLDPAPPSKDYIAVSGGIFRDCSVHDFDAVRWVTNRVGMGRSAVRPAEQHAVIVIPRPELPPLLLELLDMCLEGGQVKRVERQDVLGVFGLAV